jgi:hypothetical protein
MHKVWMVCMLPYCSLWTRVELHIVCNCITKETSHKNIESCTLPQRCPINDVDVLVLLLVFLQTKVLCPYYLKGNLNGHVWWSKQTCPLHIP